ncbi:MAG: RHS repeat-associated core domain-containing protein, partial [Steroidobacteraceae bacterium]
SVEMTYDETNRRSTITLPNGIVGSYAFDDANQLLAIAYDKGATHVGDIAYAYDVAGRRVGQSGSLAKMLVPPTVSSASYDAANRLTTWGASSLTYDDNGNLTALGSATFGWNARNQLVSTSGGTSTFAYDARGRRTGRTVAGATTSYLNDGLNPVTVDDELIVSGPTLDEFYAGVSPSGTSSYLTDALGNTRLLTDDDGNVTASYAYEPYGAASRTGSDDTTFQFTGRENDGAANLYYYRARYYSPTINRFISEDPIGLSGGTNAYAYVNGNPASLTDPYGLWARGDPFPQWVVDGGTGFGDGVSTILSFGILSTSDIRAWGGIDGGVDPCSALYRGSKYAGYAWGVGTMWAAGLNGGANSMFWSGSGNAARAAQLGTSLERTPIGWTLDKINKVVPIPMPVWKAAAATFAMNARGVAVKVGTVMGRVWSTVEAPILNWRNIPIVVIP